MKYFITKKQYNFILEQSDAMMDARVGIQNKNMQALNLDPKNPEDVKKYKEKVYGTVNEHVLLSILGVASLFIPVIGPFISAGIGLIDAGIFYKQGDTKTAGMVAMFSLIPGLGGIVSKIPGIKTLGKTGMINLANKLSKSQKLTETEISIVNSLQKNMPLLKQELNDVVSKMAQTGIKASKPKEASLLTKVAKTGLLISKPIVTAGATATVYNQGYDELQKNTPKVKVNNENLDWEFVKSAFGSSGSLDDNKKLNAAWDKGWRPGTVVPLEFQTELYKKNYDEEQQGLNTLSKLVGP
jgi:hypothetical protein